MSCRFLALLPSLFLASSLNASSFSAVNKKFAVGVSQQKTIEYFPGASFVVNQVDNKEEISIHRLGPESNTERAESVAEELPNAAVILPNGLTFNQSTPKSDDNVTEYIVVQFSLVKETSLFDEVGNYTRLASDIVTSQVGELSLSSLDNPVKIIMSVRKNYGVDGDQEEPGNITCVYWDHDLNDGLGGWSTDGCRLDSSNHPIYVCECNHLTSFALIQSLKGVWARTSKTQRYIAVYGLTISSVFLVFTVLILTGFKKLRADVSNNFVCHYCAVLFVLNAVTVVNHLTSTSKTACIIINSLSQYAILSLYMWALIQALHLYRILVTVFTKEITRLHIKAALVCYGVPLLICFITMASGSFSMLAYYSEKDKKDICYLRVNPDAIVSILVPLNLIVLVNLTIFISIVVISMRHQRAGRSKKKSDRLRLARSATGTFLVLGLAWVVGLFSLSSDSEVIDITFTAILALCGVLIFVTKVLMAEKVHRLIRGSIRIPKNAAGLKDMRRDTPGTSFFITTLFGDSRSRNQSSVSTSDAQTLQSEKSDSLRPLRQDLTTTFRSVSETGPCKNGAPEVVSIATSGISRDTSIHPEAIAETEEVVA